MNRLENNCNFLPLSSQGAIWAYSTQKKAHAMKSIVLFLAALIPAMSLAQSYSIDWFKIAGGGGTSTNAPFSLSGTIGQHDASGAMTGGNFSLTGGFWSLTSVQQTAGAPALCIGHSGTQVTVYWQNVPGWTLQQKNNLTVSGSWSASSGVTTSNGTNSLNLTSPLGTMFFRLSHP